MIHNSCSHYRSNHAVAGAEREVDNVPLQESEADLFDDDLNFI